MIAEFPDAIVFPAHPSNYRTTDGAGNPRICTPKGFVLHTPEEPADGYAYTPVFFADPGRDASTTYFSAFKRPKGFRTGIYQCVPESAMAIANGVKGKPYPKWADPNQSLNWQSNSCEIEGEADTIHETFIPGSEQFQDVTDLLRYHSKKYKYPPNREHIIGHYEVASDRRDPGQRFPWGYLIEAVNKPEEEYMKLVWVVGLYGSGGTVFFGVGKPVYIASQAVANDLGHMLGMNFNDNGNVLLTAAIPDTTLKALATF